MAKYRILDNRLEYSKDGEIAYATFVTPHRYAVSTDLDFFAEHNIEKECIDILVDFTTSPATALIMIRHDINLIQIEEPNGITVLHM